MAVHVTPAASAPTAPSVPDPATIGGLAGDRAETATGSDATTERILDATYARLVDVGLRATSVEGIAQRAGVARITVYRRFGGKDDLIRTVLVREGQRVLATLDAVVSTIDDLDDQLVEGFVTILAVARDHPLLRRLLATESDTTLPSLTVQGGPVVALAREYLAGRLLAAGDRGALAALDVRTVAEILVRLTLSFLLTPESVVPLATDNDARRFARSFILPAIHAGTAPPGPATRPDAPPPPHPETP
ncbi:TetR/AcrR family transcriptional regulator [soil metagenome]